jgi:hypothetical protein
MKHSSSSAPQLYFIGFKEHTQFQLKIIIPSDEQSKLTEFRI